jgi:hypothetical protein
VPEEQSRPDGQRRPQQNGRRRSAIPTSSAQASALIKRYYVILFQLAEDIDRGLVRDIQRQLDEIITTAPAQTEIDVWIESFGGDAHAAYKLAIDLRSRCCKLRAVIPDIAKSAATLLALGMDEIFMGAAAELGPLDLQISHPDREEVIISALDVSDVIEFLSETAFSLVITGGAGVVRYSGLRRSEVLKATFPFVAQLLEPIVSKVDPHILHQATNHLHVAEKYAAALLSRRVDQGEKEHCEKIVNHLIHHYPAHEFVIARREARKMGLPVKNLESYSQVDKVRMLYDLFTDDDNEDSITVVLDDNMLRDLQVSMTEEENENATETDTNNADEAAEETSEIGSSALSASGR